MGLSFVVYAGALAMLAGIASLAWPLRCLGIRSRWVALLVLVAGAGAALAGLAWPPPESRITSPRTRLDEFAPVYQFGEIHEIPVFATPERIFRAIHDVTAAEIPLYRTLIWIRRGGTMGPESILNPPDHVPLITVATRTTFVRLADEPAREFVMGAVVIAPPGIRLAIGTEPESFKALTQPGFAKATMSFQIVPLAAGRSLLRTETRVHATDPGSRAVFTRYWRVIAPGSAMIRLMWLRAIKLRAEAPAR